MIRFVLIVLAACFLVLGCKFSRTIYYAKSSMAQNEMKMIEKPFATPFSYNGDWILLKLKVRQKGKTVDGEFLFDTGAFTILFDSIGPFEVISPEAFEIPIKGAFGTTYRKLRFVPDVDLELGDLKVGKKRILVEDRPSAFPSACIGIVGLDFFKSCIVKLDFESNCLEIFPKTYSISDAKSLTLKSEKGRKPVVKNVRLGDLKGMNYLVDLGATTSILIQEDDELALKKNMGDSVLVYSYNQNSFFDASGIKPESNYYTKSGNSINGDPCAEFEIAGLVNPSNSLKISNLGLGFMRRVFRSIFFDVSKGKFYYQLKRNVEPLTRLNREIYISDSDSLNAFTTGPVLTSSPWYRLGVRPGQVVLRINGELPGKYIQARKGGESISVTSLTIQTDNGEKTLSIN